VADNVTLGTMSGGDVVAADDIGPGVKHQRVKIEFGVDGTATDVSATNPLPVAQQPVSAAALANVSGSASSVSLFASNASARMRMLHNDSTATLYVKFGATASITSYTVKLIPDAYYEFPIPLYTGAVDGIWSSAAGAARTTELT
jgi:hypothetical protein